MSLTNYPNGLTSFGTVLPGLNGVGNVYYVWQSSKTAIMSDMVSKYGGNVYPDGSAILYQDAGDGLAIQAAINACKGGRNDYVLVGTGNYNLTVPLTMAGKSSVHLIGINGSGLEIGTVGAAALTQTGAYENVIMEAYGELTGFQIINKAGYSAVTMADGKWRANIHNNYFHMTQGTACSIISAVGSGMSYGTIANNRFETWVAGAITSAISCAGATAVTINDNWINNYTGTMDVAINVGAGVQAMIIDNIVSDCGGAGVITAGIDVGTGAKSTVIGNRFSMPTTTALSGGVADRTFSRNFDALAGGNVAIES